MSTIYRLRDKVVYRGKYDTQIVAVEYIDSIQEFVMILVPNFMEKLFHPSDLEPVAEPENCDSEVSVDPQYIGYRGYWIARDNYGVLEMKKPPVAKKQDGCACIRCTKFCQMAENNLGNTAELGNPEIKPSAVKKAFGCFSCRDTERWWFESNGWTFI